MTYIGISMQGWQNNYDYYIKNRGRDRNIDEKWEFSTQNWNL